MAEDALDIALLVAAAVERVGGEYFVGGSVASSLQGEPRATNDIDFVVNMTRVRAFAEALGSDFEVDQVDVAYLDDWAKRLGSFALLARARADGE